MKQTKSISILSPLFEGVRGSLLLLLLCASSVSAQITHYNEQIWLNGSAIYNKESFSRDSIAFDENAPMDTVLTLFPRANVRIIRDTVYVRDTVIRQVYAHDTVYLNQCPEGTLTGAFPVSDTRKVSFAKGNIQYQASTKTWRFAEHQYDCIGEDNINISDTYTGWIDLFGWGTGNNPANTSGNSADYLTFVDWGTNTIGTDAPNTWRTLSRDEWLYLFQHISWTVARVDGKLGMVLLPQGFTVPAGMTMNIVGNGEYNKQFSESDYAANVYTADEFARLESAGVAFLPCAGQRYSNEIVMDVGTIGSYWSSTFVDTDEWSPEMAGIISFTGTNLNAYNMFHPYHARSVRLVTDL